MTVELAVVLPVLLMVGFISVNAFIFLGDCAAFDIVARMLFDFKPTMARMKRRAARRHARE